MEKKKRYFLEETVHCLAILDTFSASESWKLGHIVAKWPCMAKDGIPGVSRQEFEQYKGMAAWLCNRLNRLDELETVNAEPVPDPQGV